MHALKPMTELQQEIFDMCLQYLYDHENPQQMIKTAPLFREGYDAFGLLDDELRQLRQMILDKYNPTPQEIADLGKIFFSTHKHEFGMLAINLIKKHRPRMDRYVYEGVLEWLNDGVENISQADLLATKITPVFLELGIASLDDFETWRQSDSKWTRRVAALTMLYLMDKASPERLLEFIQPMIKDPEQIVQQGVGFFLRELWGMHSEEVESFLFANKDKLSPTVIHYATNRMAKDKKKRLTGKVNAYKSQPKKSGSDPQKKKYQPTRPQFKDKNKHQQNAPKYKSHWEKPSPQNQAYKKPRIKPNTVTPDIPEGMGDHIPDWDDFDDHFI